MPHLYISDLDGTLLDDTSKVSARSAEIISRLSADGAMISIATARTPATVVPLLKDCNIRIPVVVMTGAALWDMASQRYIDAKLLNPEAVPEVIKSFREFGVSPFVYCIEGGMLEVYHHGRMTTEEQQFVDQRKGLPLKRFHLDSTPEQVDSAKDVILIFGMGEYENLHRVAEALNQNGEYSISFYEDNASTLYYIEVFARGISKAGAIQRLAEITEADKITVYGDNLNDLSMMAIADDSVAVANAKPEVLKAASRIIGPNNEDAVANDIQKNISKNPFLTE
ncbi:MAG: HAD family hydrolase [Lachnoclostridium sp.]|nr:HAD family hydrolase [Lachnoclostridium sp.]